MPISSKPVEFYGHINVTRKVMGAILDFISKRIYIERYDEDGLPYRYIRPPIHFAHRESFVSIIRSVTQTGDNITGTTIDINQVLPRMSMNIISMAYDPSRKLNKFNKVNAEEYDSETGDINRVIMPVPYRLDMELNLLTKSIDDTYQVLEQLVPFFTPSLSLDINVLDGFKADSVPFTIESIVPGGSGESEFSIVDDRVFETIIALSAKCNYYYIKRNSKIIRNLITQYHTQSGEDYKMFKKYELTANNITPVLPVAERADEDMSQTTTDY